MTSYSPFEEKKSSEHGVVRGWGGGGFGHSFGVTKRQRIMGTDVPLSRPPEKEERHDRLTKYIQTY